MNNFSIKRFLQIAFALLIGCLCLYYVVVSFNWSQIWLSAGKVNFIFFFLATSVTLLAYFFVRTLRWRFLLSGEDIEIPFSKLYLYSAMTIGISTVTPFQSGEALKVELLRKHGGDRLSGYSIFFLERIFDLFTILGLAILSTGFGFDYGIKRVYLFLILIVLAVILITAIGCLYLLPSEKTAPIKNWINGTLRKKGNILTAFGLTLISWATIIYGWKLALAFFSINISFFQSASLVSLTTLLAVLSFVPGAVGVSEISVSTILSAMGIETSLAQTGAIAIRAFALVILVLTLLHWLYFKFINKNSV